MKSLMLFLQRVLLDMEDLCGTSTRLDLKEIQSRFEHEGESFLTISLPNFGKDLQKGLDRGYVAPDLFTGFRWRGGLPRLLGGFLELVFDRQGGRLLENPSIDAIFAIRQITLSVEKILLPCAEARVKKAKDGYFQCERDVRASDARIKGSETLASFKRIGQLLWNDVFQAIEEDIFYGRIVPGHGPGATAERLSSNAKWVMQEWPQRLDRWFPHWEYLTPSDHPFWIDRVADVRLLEPGQERPVRVVTVPKTLKAPRIIAIEPACMMFIQQGILNRFEEEFSRNDFPGKFVRWSNREPNQLMALQGSRFGDLATLDLSEASDRVSNQHVRALLENFPHLAGAVDSCRSRKADVDGKVIRLAKFASMGSALCFPFESIVFLTLVFVGIEKGLNRRLTKKRIQSFLGSVRLYGDDIIVPTEFVAPVIETLETFGFRVNLDKSFWTGKFRESCGAEYYDGVDVSVTRLRHVPPTSRQDVEAIIGTVASRNLFYRAGMWRTASLLDEWLGKLIPYPIVGERSPVLGRFSYLGIDYSETKLDNHLHAPFVKGYVEVSKSPKDPLDDYGALLKCLTLLHNRSLGDRDEDQLLLKEPSKLPVAGEHLERSGRPLARRIKLRWGPAI